MKPILTIAFSLLIFTNAPADEVRKFDEYADLPFSAEKARLDYLGIQLKMSPDDVGWYVIFAGSDSCPGEARRRAIRAKNYIVKKHGIRPDRVIWSDEGYREGVTVEIWVRARSLGKPRLSNSATVNKNEVQIGPNCKLESYIRQKRIKL
jgi:hypothetical protein